jgi:CoA-transferase family III
MSELTAAYALVAQAARGAQLASLDAAGHDRTDLTELPGASSLAVTGPAGVLPSCFDVTGLATASVAAATLAAARLLAARRGSALGRVTVDTRAACAAFAAEGLFTPVGWARPELWDPIAGNYLARDGWIRLHTNYAYHRAAAERVLGAADRESVQQAVASWTAGELETAVVQAGGCAAAMHDRTGWLTSPAGAAAATAPALTIASRPADAAPPWRGTVAGQPFSGVRVLDLTRVIAGPDSTKFLAAYGAEVLRIDPPGFAEVESLLPETTAGKRTAALDLTTAAGRAAFEHLVRRAHVLVTGYRDDAMTALGYPDPALTALNPDLILASLNAYGDAGPWRTRRGFDSLVQMSSGIAAAGAQWRQRDEPVPLPVQALDHATGYLLAAAIAQALTSHLTGAAVDRIRGSLIGAANLLWSLPRPADIPGRPDPRDFPLVDTTTAWGPARRVAVPSAIDGTHAAWPVEAGPLGRHAPEWISAA